MQNNCIACIIFCYCYLNLIWHYIIKDAPIGLCFQLTAFSHDSLPFYPIAEMLFLYFQDSNNSFSHFALTGFSKSYSDNIIKKSKRTLRISWAYSKIAERHTEVCHRNRGVPTELAWAHMPIYIPGLEASKASRGNPWCPAFQGFHLEPECPLWLMKNSGVCLVSFQRPV